MQVATGFAITFYYRATVMEALSSINYLMTRVRYGWFIRSVHRWSASLMILSILLHIFRVYLTGAFKSPREATWITGVILAVLSVSFGVTGYSLPYDQVGYWALRIVSGVPDAIPIINIFIPIINIYIYINLGHIILLFIRGDASVGQPTLNRFYSAHTLLLPLLTAIFILAHFLMIRKQGISGPL